MSNKQMTASTSVRIRMDDVKVFGGIACCKRHGAGAADTDARRHKPYPVRYGG